MRVFHEDARPFLRRTDERYDVIIVDVYRQPYIPFYLATREFFELARDRLRPGGMVVVNVGHPEGQDELEKVLSAHDGGRLRDRRCATRARTRTRMILASDAPLSAARLRAPPRACRAELRPVARAAAGRLGAALEGGRSTRTTGRRSSG